MAAENAIPLEALADTSRQRPAGNFDEFSAYPPIADYAFLSDCEVTALVAPSGSVEWMCLPKMDGPSVFGAMLDRDAGWFRFGPDDVNVPSDRRYLAEGGHPNLAHLYKFLKSSDYTRPVTAQVLELNHDGTSSSVRLIKTAEICHLAKDDPPHTVLARIFVIEDLNPDTIEALGVPLGIEPAFFADHIRDSFLEPRIDIGRCPHLPSVSEITSFYTIDYYTAVNLERPTVHPWRCDFNVRRRVDTFHND